MPKRLSFEDFQYIYKKSPRLCVDLVVKNKDGFLLTLRNIPPSKGFWHLPGGTILFGEKIVEAAKRVAKQELGVDIKIIKNLSVIEYFSNSVNFGHVVSIALLIEIFGTIKLDRQAKEFKYFKEIPENTIEELKVFLNSNGQDFK